MSFFDKLNAAIARNQSLLYVGLDPNPELMPERYCSGEDTTRLIDGLWEWLQFIITETADQVCAYKPTLGFYEALGVPGLELLHKTLAAIPTDIPVILDAKHGDINTSTVFAKTVFQQWDVDAITLNPYAGQDHVAPFLVYPGKAVFILSCTSSPAAVALQQYPNPETPFYLQVVNEAKNWGTPEQVGLEVGISNPEVLARIRAVAPERGILARSIWTEGGSDLTQLLAAGLDKNGEGLLIPISPEFLGSDRLSEKVRSLREQVNQIRQEIVRESVTCNLWMSDVCLLTQHRHQDLILQLYDIGCILFGSFVQASGATFPYYIDLRKIISNPQVFNLILLAYADILKDLQFDRIAGIPYGSLPTATGLALRLNYPMIFPRKEVKAHGTRRLIEGNFELGETVVVVDDILISGKSAIEGAEKIKSAGLKVEDIVVFMDHEQGVKDRLRASGYRPHSVLTISEVTEILYQAGRIDEEQFTSMAKL
ncbi:MAG: bifunctional orotidine-5'-phosphate decarboxylase/orotate phosphoribosyltransferase [Kastovskya adunca ATA6-11-RM4]|jgi:uridine monophosphate synthetase|nr:bifunctional orotidine-5'-phosphate decarboxylase/orotate phosphoribosyltransferase [Kastovskya adunca ATA6-11-RM4]